MLFRKDLFVAKGIDAMLGIPNTWGKILAAAKALARKACQADGELPSHEAWWADYWTRSYLTIPDARLEWMQGGSGEEKPDDAWEEPRSPE